VTVIDTRSNRMISPAHPPKRYRLTVAWGPYPKGHVFEPTGIYRQQLLARGVIEEVKDDPVARAQSADDQPAAPKGRGKPKTPPTGTLV
jgi:hypothetical protein